VSFIRANIAKETTTTTGTGNYTLLGAVTDFIALSAVCVNGDYFPGIVRMGAQYEEGYYQWTTGGVIVRVLITRSSNGNAAVNWGAGTKYLSIAEGVDNDVLRTRALASAYTNSTTTGTNVSGLDVSVIPGTYHVRYNLLVRSAAAATGMSYGVNYTGTVTDMSCELRYPSTGTTASTGIADDASAGAVDQLIDSFVTRTESTTVPNLGPLTGVATLNVTHRMTLEWDVVVSDSGDLELWAASEVAASQITLQIGSNVKVLKVA
jgi:hypothetical protein